MKDSFIFYRSFQEAIDGLDEPNQLIIYRAIANYALDKEMPSLDGFAKVVFTLIKPQLDANWRKFENGKKGAEHGVKGGAPKGNINAKKDKTTPKQPLSVYETTPIKNKDLYPFEVFWNLYDKKVGQKEKVKKKWDSLSLDTQKEILEYLPKYKEGEPNKQFRKNPETFFNNESWNDEIIEKGGDNAKAKQFTKSSNDSKGADRKAEIMRRASQAVANSDRATASDKRASRQNLDRLADGILEEYKTN